MNIEKWGITEGIPNITWIIYNIKTGLQIAEVENKSIAKYIVTLHNNNLKK